MCFVFIMVQYAETTVHVLVLGDVQYIRHLPEIGDAVGDQ